eukprot:PhF_6_TR40341/c0_g1_i1/m.60000
MSQQTVLRVGLVLIFFILVYIIISPFFPSSDSPPPHLHRLTKRELYEQRRKTLQAKLQNAHPTFIHIAKMLELGTLTPKESDTPPATTPPERRRRVIPYLATFIMQEWVELDMLLSSIDVPIDYLHLVVNDPAGKSRQYVKNFSRSMYTYSQEGRVILSYSRRGDPHSFSESCNIVLRDAFQHQSRPAVPYVLLVNADVSFGPNSLHHILQYYETNNLKSSVVGMGLGFSALILSRNVVDRVGTFDENFYPAYWEDVDYQIRLNREGINTVELNSLPNIKNHVVVNHHQSMSLKKSTPEYRKRHSRVDRWIYAYMKWGFMERHLGYADLFNHPTLFRHPYNVTSLPTSYWVKDTKYRECVRTGEVSTTPGNQHQHYCWFNLQVVLEEALHQQHYSFTEDEKRQLQWKISQPDDVSERVQKGKCIPGVGCPVINSTSTW